MLFGVYRELAFNLPFLLSSTMNKQQTQCLIERHTPEGQRGSCPRRGQHCETNSVGRSVGRCGGAMRKKGVESFLARRSERSTSRWARLISEAGYQLPFRLSPQQNRARTNQWTTFPIASQARTDGTRYFLLSKDKSPLIGRIESEAPSRSDPIPTSADLFRIFDSQVASFRSCRCWRLRH